MNIIVFSDLHGTTDMIHKLSGKITNSDLVLLSGDITHFGRDREIEKIIDIISGYNENILAVPGNCDYPEVNQFLVKNNMSLDCRHKIIDGIYFAGVGGSLPCPGTTPNEYEEDNFAMFFEEIIKEKPGSMPFVLLMHQPPYNTKTDRLSGGEQVGSRSVRNFIEQHQPGLCFCGHIHESVAKDTIGKTIVINPGPLGMANYAFAEIKQDEMVAGIGNYFKDFT